MDETDASAPEQPESGQNDPKKDGLARSLGLGIITGAADDDVSAVGTYASAGAQFGPAFLWLAPLLFPMMFVVTYLSSKLGQVGGKGLFDALRDHYPRWILWPTLIGVMIGNTVEAAADLGGMAAALNLFIPVPIPIIVVVVATIILILQILGSYKVIRNTFRWLALVLFAYIASAILAEPDPWEVLRGTFIPRIEFSREFLSMLVAIIGASLSAYIYTWQSNVEVEEEIAEGRTTLEQRRGATPQELRQSRNDVLTGMLFSNVIMYFIMLSTAETLHKAGETDITTAAQAAAALRPLAGEGAYILFATGLVAVGLLAVPIMTIGAAYDFCQAMGWKASLNAKASEDKGFYVIIAGVTAAAVLLNFLGINPMYFLVYAGIVQGFAAPPLFLLIVLMTNNRDIMGDNTNSFWLNVLAIVTLLAIFAASLGLVLTWLL
jgi:Mn2+/Fe2+ NRAMP family transporter